LFATDGSEAGVLHHSGGRVRHSDPLSEMVEFRIKPDIIKTH
jgi:hypothetical protein